MKQNRCTPKQTKFAQLLASGENQSAAYRESYNADNMTPQSIHNESCQLAKHPVVAEKVRELVAAADEVVIQDRVASREQVLQELTHFMRVATPQDSGKIRATELLGKHYGLFTDHIQISPPERTSKEIQAEIVELLSGIDP
jgi:hypothetical protein